MVMIRRLLLVLLLLLVLVVGLLFSLQNDVPVSIDLLVVQLTARPVAVWILLAFALGGFLGLLISSFALLRLQASRARLARRLEQREKDLAQSRELVVTS